MRIKGKVLDHIHGLIVSPTYSLFPLQCIASTASTSPCVAVRSTGKILVIIILLIVSPCNVNIGAKFAPLDKRMKLSTQVH